MRLTMTSKILLAVLIIGAATYTVYRIKGSPTGDPGLLGRPLRVGVVTWPGYAGGIVANNGFKPNHDSIYWKKHNLEVEFLLMEDVDVRNKAFAKGGPDGVDIVWSTVDFWANELPGFLKDGVKARAIMQVDWSQGGDAIVADPSIQRIEDLYGKKISLALFTPSHWLLEYNLQHSSLSSSQQAEIVKSLVGKNASPDARADFVAKRVDAAVVWEPDVTEALNKRPDAHVLISSRDASHLIADLMVAREDFISQHPDVIKAFVAGWLEGTVDANRNPDLVVKLLMENEPLYKDLGPDMTRKGLPTVKWADMLENNQMFGLDGKPPLFDQLFEEAGNSWARRGYISSTTKASDAKDTRFLAELFSRETPPPEPTPIPRVWRPATHDECEKARSTDLIHVEFAGGSAVLDDNAKTILDKYATTPRSYPDSYFCVEGNTDNTIPPGMTPEQGRRYNVQLSEKRAESVVDYLALHYNRDSRWFTHFGNGPDHPVASNAGADGRRQNRRTDIAIVIRN